MLSHSNPYPLHVSMSTIYIYSVRTFIIHGNEPKDDACQGFENLHVLMIPSASAFLPASTRAFLITKPRYFSPWDDGGRTTRWNCSRRMAQRSRRNTRPRQPARDMVSRQWTVLRRLGISNGLTSKRTSIWREFSSMSVIRNLFEVANLISHDARGQYEKTYILFPRPLNPFFTCRLRRSCHPSIQVH